MLMPPLPTEPTIGRSVQDSASRGPIGSGSAAGTSLESPEQPFASHIDRADRRRPEVDDGLEPGPGERNPAGVSGEDASETAPDASAGTAEEAQDAPAEATEEGTGEIGLGLQPGTTEPARPANQPGEGGPTARPRPGTDAPVQGDARPTGTAAAKPGTTHGAASTSSPASGSITNESPIELRPVEPRSAARTDLASLLDEYGIESTSRRSAVNGTGSAAARAEEVQQALAIEQAARLQGTARNATTGLQSALIEQGAGDARETVLRGLTTDVEPDSLQQRVGRLTGRALGALASQRGGSLTLRLDPPNLGQVTLRMSVVDATVRTEILAENPVARRLLERGLDGLRLTLEARGLQVERLAVGGAAAGSESGQTRSESSSNQTGAQTGGGEDEASDASGRESRGRREQARDEQQGGQEPARTSFSEALDTE